MVGSAMKRGREEGEEDSFDTANCLMLLSKVGEINTPSRESPSFKCKTCNREFSSFQALGGHRASHKKPKPMTLGPAELSCKPKMHECHICGVEFGIGQALGGHMRKHRAEAINAGLVSHNITAMPLLDKGINLLSLDLNLMPLEND